MQLESQKFTQLVLEWLDTRPIKKESDKKNIEQLNSRVKAVPAMLQNNGLMMTLVTLAASSVKNDPEIARFICQYLHDADLVLISPALDSNCDNQSAVNSTIPKLQTLPLTRYFFAQTKTAQLVNWVKQITQAQKELAKPDKSESSKNGTRTESGEAMQ